MTIRAAALAGIAIALLVAACGGGEDGREPPNTTRPTIEDSQPAPTPNPTLVTGAATPDDAFAYCASVRTTDETRTGDDVPESLLDALLVEFELIGSDYWDDGRFFHWRCFEGQVLGCWVGANLWCGLANTSREPSERVASHCRENPDSRLSSAITGHDAIYIWVCEGTTAVISPQKPVEVDERGFLALFWREVTPLVEPAVFCFDESALPEGFAFRGELLLDNETMVERREASQQDELADNYNEWGRISGSQQLYSAGDRRLETAASATTPLFDGRFDFVSCTVELFQDADGASQAFAGTGLGGPLLGQQDSGTFDLVSNPKIGGESRQYLQVHAVASGSVVLFRTGRVLARVSVGAPSSSFPGAEKTGLVAETRRLALNLFDQIEGESASDHPRG